jgi:hypothetical protein
MSSKEKGRPSRIDESVGEWRITAESIAWRSASADDPKLRVT